LRVVNLDQRSEDWLSRRNTGIGSSDAAAIVGISPWPTARKDRAQKVAALRGQRVAGKDDNGAMARGRRLEPVAGKVYEELMGWKIPPLCCMHDEHDWLKASCDGYNAERNLVAEIKAPNKVDHAGAREGVVPEKYVAQVNHLLLVTGGKRLHYISYNDYFPESGRLAVVDMPRDEELLAALFEAEKAFWEKVLAWEVPQ
jgi:putative phage-type endonuclease